MSDNFPRQSPIESQEILCKPGDPVRSELEWLDIADFQVYFICFVCKFFHCFIIESEGFFYLFAENVVKIYQIIS